MPPRYIPERPFPLYAFVPGRSPHPISDPRGHSHGQAPERPPAPDAERWQESAAYLHGTDLFNHGYYWEAHEAWEALWHACGRSGRTADVLRGLIKLAAAGVKVREGRPQGAAEHARRAALLFHQTAADQPRCLGLDLMELARWADAVAKRPPKQPSEGNGPTVVFEFVLRPG